jgi:hypothetical protein
MTNEQVRQLYTYLSVSERQYINQSAFSDIAAVFINYLDTYKQGKSTCEVCDASMGHGKTTTLICLIKWMIDKNIDIPLLLVTREISLADRIYESINSYRPGTIANVTRQNKEYIEKSLLSYQFIIIQQQRLKNLALGYGNKSLYNYWHDGVSKYVRALIIDEKPIMNSSDIFNIGNQESVMNWFDELAKPDDLTVDNIQKMRQTIINVINQQIDGNITTYTSAMPKTIEITNLLNLMNDMKKDKRNSGQFDMLQRMAHFKKIITRNKAGRIDEYHVANRQGKKIFVSEYIDYRKKMKMNILILDGTAHETGLQYRGYKAQHVINRNDYSRLHLHVDEINTSADSRNKKGHTTQKAIARRINEVRRIHNDLFVLPMKDEITIYKKLGAITDNDLGKINLLNTTGKNDLGDYHSLYLTSLPRRNPDYYKAIALAFWPDCDLTISTDNNDANWFTDDHLEWIYRGELKAELLQIIHRTALRHIDSNDEIDVYIAYDEGLDRVGAHYPIALNINENYMNGKAIISYHKLIDMSLYGRQSIVTSFATDTLFMVNSFGLELPCRVGEIDDKFRIFLKNHWDKQHNDINYIMNEFSLEIYIDNHDHNNKKVRFIS